MALKSTIILNNTTGSPVTIETLSSIVVPGSGQLNITDDFGYDEVSRNDELTALINAGTITINDGLETFSNVASLNYLDPLSVKQKTNDINQFLELVEIADGDLVVIEDASDSFRKKKASAESLLYASNVTANAFSTAQSETSSNSQTYPATSAADVQNKVVASISGVAGNTYKIAYSAEFNSNANNKQVAVRVWNETDDTVVAESIQQTNNNTNYFMFSGVHYELFSTTETKTFVLQFRANDNGVTCAVRRATIDVGRRI
jgi:hypothetical protein